MPRCRPALAALAVLVAGCVDASAFLLGDERYEPRAPTHAIAVYDSFADVPFHYVKVARVVASGGRHAAWDKVFEELKSQARQAGGDAIVLQRGGEDTADLDGEGGVAMRRTLWALAIRREEPKPVGAQ